MIKINFGKNAATPEVPVTTLWAWADKHPFLFKGMIASVVGGGVTIVKVICTAATKGQINFFGPSVSEAVITDALNKIAENLKATLSNETEEPRETEEDEWNYYAHTSKEPEGNTETGEVLRQEGEKR